MFHKILVFKIKTNVITPIRTKTSTHAHKSNQITCSTRIMSKARMLVSEYNKKKCTFYTPVTHPVSNSIQKANRSIVNRVSSVFGILRKHLVHLLVCQKISPAIMYVTKFIGYKITCTFSKRMLLLFLSFFFPYFYYENVGS